MGLTATISVSGYIIQFSNSLDVVDNIHKKKRKKKEQKVNYKIKNNNQISNQKVHNTYKQFTIFGHEKFDKTRHFVFLFLTLVVEIITPVLYTNV